jgi:hypothetical protein
MTLPPTAIDRRLQADRAGRGLTEGEPHALTR